MCPLAQKIPNNIAKVIPFDTAYTTSQGRSLIGTIKVKIKDAIGGSIQNQETRWIALTHHLPSKTAAQDLQRFYFLFFIFLQR